MASDEPGTGTCNDPSIPSLPDFNLASYKQTQIGLQSWEADTQFMAGSVTLPSTSDERLSSEVPEGTEAMRLLVVEDNDELAEALQQSFRRCHIHCDIAVDALDAEVMIRTRSYALIILDLGLPDEDGLDLLRRLRSSRRAEPILILTARSALEDRVEGLQAGADDYMLKPFYFEELHARVEAILRRETGQINNRIVAGPLQLDPNSRQFKFGEKTLDMPVREGELLELLMRRFNLVVHKQMLEDQLFGADDALSSNAVEVYIHRIRKRLENEGIPLTLQTVRGLGYMLLER